MPFHCQAVCCFLIAGAKVRLIFELCKFFRKFLSFYADISQKSINFASQLAKKRANRGVAQLVAHYVRDVGVGRSSRLTPTKRKWQTIRSAISLIYTFHLK